MRRRPVNHSILRTALFSGLWVVATLGPARADPPAPETYQAIVQRNPFGLRPAVSITAAAPSSEKKILPPIALLYLTYGVAAFFYRHGNRHYIGFVGIGAVIGLLWLALRSPRLRGKQD